MPKTINKAVALRISKLLEEKKMTKYRLEKITGLSHSTFTRIFNEINNDIMMSTILRIINALGMTVQEFFDDELFNMENLEFEF